MKNRHKDDATFVQFIVDQLAGFGEVRYRRLFGGYGLYCGSAFFGIVDKDRAYFKTDASTQQVYDAAGVEPFRPTSTQTRKNYLELPPPVLADAAELSRLAESAVAVARRQAKV